MSYRIECREKNGEGCTYEVRTRHELIPLVTRLIEHGRKTYGEPLVSIHITSQKQTAKAGEKKKGGAS